MKITKLFEDTNQQANAADVQVVDDKQGQQPVQQIQNQQNNQQAAGQAQSAQQNSQQVQGTQQQQGQQQNQQGQIKEDVEEPRRASSWLIQYYDGREVPTSDFEAAVEEAESEMEIKNIFAEDGEFPYWSEEEGVFDLNGDGVIVSRFSDPDADYDDFDENLQEYWWNDDDHKNFESEEEYEAHLEAERERADAALDAAKENGWDTDPLDLDFPDMSEDDVDEAFRKPGQRMHEALNVKWFKD